MLDDRNLRNQPIAVGGSPDSRSVVTTCNYIAREFGVHSAMPMRLALRACPELVIIPTNMPKYKSESARIQRIFKDYTHLVEPLSLDEAYLDVSASAHASGSATLIAEEIRDRVKAEVGITISAGIAPNKFLAKVASDWNKPDGQCTIAPAEVADFVKHLPVSKIFGVGAVTQNKLHELNIHTCGDLEEHSLQELTTRFGKFGVRLYELCRGIDDRPVRPSRRRKSLSAEQTYAVDLPTKDVCLKELTNLFEDLQRRIATAGCERYITQRTIKVRFSNFATTTVASKGVRVDLDDYIALFNTAWARQRKPVRLLGMGVTLSTNSTDSQLALFT